MFKAGSVIVPAMKYFLAGGAVRNMLLGKEPKDFDMVFSGTEADFLARNLSARKLGDGPAYGLNKLEYTPLGQSMAQNIALRDFTINAFLLEDNGILHMHPKSLEHLRSGVLSPVSAQSISMDPLRSFRAARFCACLPQFLPDDYCFELMRQTASTQAFKEIAPERVGRECVKAMSGPKPGNFLRVLEKGKALAYWFKELNGAKAIPAGPPQYHEHDVLEHIASIMDRSAAQIRGWLQAHTTTAPDLAEEMLQVTVWMSLCHDLGKVSTPHEILPHHYKHEIRGMHAAAALADRLRLSNRLREAGALSAKLHMKAGIYYQLRPATRVDLLAEAHAKNLVVPLFLLAQADSGTDSLLDMALTELGRMLSVKLPRKWKNLGEQSGRYLREMRCNAVARKPGF